jgi:hypothetical protein
MKSTLARLLAAAALGTAGVAHAGNVNWSVGISLPPLTTVVSNGPYPVYAPGPVFAPAPVVYAPPPVVYAPPRVVYAPPRVVYAPVPVVYAPRYVRPVPVVYYGGRAVRGHRGEWRGHRHGRWHDHD